MILEQTPSPVFCKTSKQGLRWAQRYGDGCFHFIVVGLDMRLNFRPARLQTLSLKELDSSQAVSARP